MATIRVEPVKDIQDQLSFVEWLTLHQGAREVDDAPGWVFKSYGPEDLGGPFYRLHIRHRDGREFDVDWDIYHRNGLPFPATFDFFIHTELAERYPDEYDAPMHNGYVGTWTPGTHVSAALDALVQGNLTLFVQRVMNAAEEMGVTFTHAQIYDAMLREAKYSYPYAPFPDAITSGPLQRISPDVYTFNFLTDAKKETDLRSRWMSEPDSFDPDDESVT